MKCGCAANAKIGPLDGKMVDGCAVHDCVEAAVPQPDLTNRSAHCDTCKKSKADSSSKLPFFKYQPLFSNDKYYCGCRGWE
jgi:hypothetical protein